MKHFAEEAIQLYDMSKAPDLAGVRLLLFDVSLLPHELIFELGKLLSPKELRKAARFRFMKDRMVYLAGRGMLRKMATEILGITSDELLIEEEPFGKPYFVDFGSILPFNMANSKEIVAIAFDFGRRDIGLDVEKIDLNFDYWEVAGHFFSERECSQIHSHKDYYRLWTKKEAFLKVTGAGLVEDLPGIDLSGTVNQVQVKDERLLPFRNQIFTLYTFDNDEIAFTLAVAGGQTRGEKPPTTDPLPFSVSQIHLY